MTTLETIGRSTGGKPINLSQLQDELVAGGVATGDGLGMSGEYVYAYDASGLPSDFDEAQRATADQVIADHVGMRDKTTEEYADEFQAEGTTAARKQEIRDIQSGLLPPEQVPMETT